MDINIYFCNYFNFHFKYLRSFLKLKKDTCSKLLVSSCDVIRRYNVRICTLNVKNILKYSYILKTVIICEL